ncbi:MAG: hypothetical protein AVDCRST_MAG59-4714 [uncultured Thermomicrobiales bacterium]|uniref:ADP-ribosylglycohydrolase n=1 Tax=uncultured Thermomicrobiales bacterium TaxID=1645740 RepID=A0A6J4VKN9_9BACT|nr:MAG: hypothetical protein AVDCRST_MAG59-4714 [uncultured Thermomicrobiales bacterium]
MPVVDGGISLKDRYAGCLLGLACGDALGGPVEFVTRREIARTYPDGVREFVGGGWLDLRPGEVTDDTQLTLALARSLTDGGLEMDLLAAEMLAWYRSNPKDIGTTTRQALLSLANGADWRRSGEDALAGLPKGAGAANGAVMRCAPVALRFRSDPVRLVEASLASARITHAEPRAAWAAVAVNQGLVHLLGGGTVADLPAAATEGVDEPEVRSTILAAAAVPEESVRAGGFVLETIQAAFWSVAHAPSAEEAIVTAVGFGADADTTGAVTGALAGAHWGSSALPERWLAFLEPRRELQDHAARLLAISES